MDTNEILKRLTAAASDYDHLVAAEVTAHNAMAEAHTRYAELCSKTGSWKLDVDAENALFSLTQTTLCHDTELDEIIVERSSSEANQIRVSVKKDNVSMGFLVQYPTDVMQTCAPSEINLESLMVETADDYVTIMHDRMIGYNWQACQGSVDAGYDSTALFLTIVCAIYTTRIKGNYIPGAVYRMRMIGAELKGHLDNWYTNVEEPN